MTNDSEDKIRHDSSDRKLLWRTAGVIVAAIVVVGGYTTAFVFTFENQGDRWGAAMDHLMVGVVFGPVLLATMLGYHIIQAYRKFRRSKRSA